MAEFTPEDGVSRSRRFRVAMQMDAEMGKWTHSENVAAVWRQVLGVPLKKGEDGIDVRPILIGEALLALPGAWLNHITRSKAQTIFKHAQFGIGVPAGAEVMISLCQALIGLDPDDALFVLDTKNAFGEVSRAEILEEALLVLPEIAPFLLKLWGEDSTSIYTASGPKNWSVIGMYDGLF